MVNTIFTIPVWLLVMRMTGSGEVCHQHPGGCLTAHYWPCLWYSQSPSAIIRKQEAEQTYWVCVLWSSNVEILRQFGYLMLNPIFWSVTGSWLFVIVSHVLMPVLVWHGCDRQRDGWCVPRPRLVTDGPSDQAHAWHRGYRPWHLVTPPPRPHPPHKPHIWKEGNFNLSQCPRSLSSWFLALLALTSCVLEF